MEKNKLDRINQLSRLSKERALTPQEAQEQKALRLEYIDCWRRGLQETLDNTYVNCGGEIRKLRKKEDKTQGTD